MRPSDSHCDVVSMQLSRIDGIFATVIGPVPAATLTAVTDQWWPRVARVVSHAANSWPLASLDLEVRGYDKVHLDDAV